MYERMYKIIGAVFTLSGTGAVCIEHSDEIMIHGQDEIVTVHMAIGKPSGNMKDFDKVSEAVNERDKRSAGNGTAIGFL